MAPTASGKTEAALAPLLEFHWEALRAASAAGSNRAGSNRDDAGPILLITSPTRALANDLFRRLSPRLVPMGITLGRWTGDAHDGGALQPVTILTPEGFDGRLSRVPHRFSEVRAVWLEELQVVDGSPRGDQLRLLLSRLRARLEHAGRPAPQRVATSATVADPQGLAARFLDGDATVVHGGAPSNLPARGARRALGRPMRVMTGEAEGLVSVEPLREKLLELVAQHGFRKVLLFADSRARAELVCAGLSGKAPFGDAVLVHHGSLERETRRTAERRFLDATIAACVATSTLEVGIDIGDVDLIVLLSCPPTVSALLQRAGRAGRRTGVAQVLTWVPEPLGALRLQILLGAIRAGIWLEDPPVFHDGVMVQQVFSVLGERESERRFGVNAAALVRRFPGVWDEAKFTALLEGLAQKGWLGGDSRGYTWGAKAEGPWRRGELHANMAERRDEGVELVDAMTGRTLGRVREDAQASDRVTFGGRSRDVVGLSGKRLLTRSTGSDLESAGAFAKSEGPAVPMAQARALLASVDLPVGARLSLGMGAVALVHGLGTGGGLLLRAIYQRYRSVKVKSAGPYGLVMEITEAMPWPGWPKTDFLGSDEAKIAIRMGASPWHRLLPDDLRREATLALAGAPAVKAFLEAGPGATLAPLAEGDPRDEWRLALLWEG